MLGMGIVAVAFSLAAAASPSAANCPPEGVAAAGRAFPDSVVLTCSGASVDAKPIWRLEGATADGRTLRVDLSADWRMLQGIEGIELAAVPPETLEALRERYPSSALAYVVRVTRADGRRIYEVTLSDGSTKTRVAYDVKWVLIGED